MTAYPTAATDRRAEPFLRFSPEQTARLVALHAVGLTDREIAARMPDVPGGRLSVYKKRRRLKLKSHPRRHQIPPAVVERIRDAVRRGLSLNEITDGLADVFPPGLDYRHCRDRVRNFLRTLRLTPGRATVIRRPTLRPEARQAYLRRMAERRAANARLAASYGLPPDVKPRQVHILTMLAGSPLSRAEINRACGLHPETRETMALFRLVQRGLVSRLAPPRPRVFGTNSPLYLLTGHAMSLMTGEGRTHR